MVLVGALTTTLLLAACNPIPPEPSPATSPPAPTLTSEPMQANLNDFAFAFSVIFDEDIEPEAYVEIISKIDDCTRAMAGDDIYALHTPGREAAVQWVTIMLLTMDMHSDLFEEIKPNTPSFYNRLIQLHEFCMEDKE